MPRDPALYLTLGVFGFIGLCLACSPAQSAQDRVIAGFTACGSKTCQYFEIEAPSVSACNIYAQQAISQWLRENGKGDWTLRTGWKCYINRRGVGFPA